MLTCRLTIRSLALTRNVATSSALRNQEPPRRFDQEVPSFKPLNEFRNKKISEDKKRLEWRKNLQEQPGFYKSKLSLFESDEEAPSALALIAQPVDFSPRGFKQWWANYNVRKDRYLQQFVPERLELLGNDLAAAHFLLFRGVKYKLYYV